MNRPLNWMAILLIAGAAGCSGKQSGNLKLAPASGKVTLNDQPVTKGSLSLMPAEDAEKGLRAISAEIQSDGSFSLSTYQPGDGAAPGKYDVTLHPGTDIDPKKASVDPSAMMAAAAGITTQKIEVTIPEEGITNLDLKFKGAEKKGGKAGSSMLGQ